MRNRGASGSVNMGMNYSGSVSRARAGLFSLFALVPAALSFAAAPAPKPCAMTAAALFDKVSPAVVSITTTSINPFDRNERMEHVSASGVMIDASGLVLTNSHVVFGRQVINVTLDDGSVLPARIVGADPVFDLAVIRIPVPPSGSLPVASLGDSDSVRVGEDVYAIGNPLGLDQTLTHGIVSGINRMIPDVPYALTEPLIQTDAPINPGNSGGPLVNNCGHVLGITTAMLPSAENIGFAIPASLVREVVPQLIKFGRVVRPWLGVQGQLVTADLKSVFRLPIVDGMLVEVVEPGSPAEALDLHGGALEVTLSGQEYLLGGDILTAINNAPITNPDQLATALASLRVGQNVTLDFFRDGKINRLQCVLPERPVLPGDVRGAASNTSARQKPRSHRRGM